MRYPSCAAWLASAALLISSGCVSAQAPIIEAGGSYGAPASSAPKGNAAPPAAAEPQGSSGSLLLQLQSLQQEVMELRGIVEEQNHQIETLKQQSLDRYLELDRRIGGGAAASATAAGAANTGAAIDAGGSPTPPPGTTSGAGAQVAMPSNGAAAVDNGAAAPAGEYEAYKLAYAKVKEQNFTAAVQSFNDFIKTYPSSTLTPNAYYWLGELYLQTPQDLKASEQAFSRVVKDYPQHSKAPDSLYKLGRVQFMKGDKAKAKETLQQVIDEYGASGSAAPQLAKQFLDQNFR